MCRVVKNSFGVFHIDIFGIGRNLYSLGEHCWASPYNSIVKDEIECIGEKMSFGHLSSIFWDRDKSVFIR